jgi:hypothetical protein
MEKILLTISIICFLNSMFWVVADLKGTAILKFIVRTIGFIGAILPIVYWLKLLEVI